MIPARLNSKGIPRKVLRPFNGRPLLCWVTDECLMVDNSEVWISTDSQEIIQVCKEIYGDKINYHLRALDLGSDSATLDEVALEFLSSHNEISFGAFVTIQATSPLLKATIINKAIKQYYSSNCSTVLSVTETRKLSWKKENNEYKPAYKERVNRQYLEPSFNETGQFVISYPNHIMENHTRINKPIDLYVTDVETSIDIDTPTDWLFAEKLVSSRRLIIITSANPKLGSGHLMRQINIAWNFPDYNIEFYLVDTSDDYSELITSMHFKTSHFEDKTAAFEAACKANPSILIADLLDTSRNIAKLLMAQPFKKVSFEDLGEGSRAYDLVINELYPAIALGESNILSGPSYAILRQEFFNDYSSFASMYDIMISFGGTDPSDLTLKTLNALNTTTFNQLKVLVVLGLGATRLTEQVLNHKENFKELEVKIKVDNIAMLMAQSKMLITSAGRTIWEGMALSRPILSMCQNHRELTHLYAKGVNGIVNLGLGSSVEDSAIQEVVSDILSNDSPTPFNDEIIKQLKSGTETVVTAIKNL